MTIKSQGEERQQQKGDASVDTYVLCLLLAIVYAFQEQSVYHNNYEYYAA